jgi:hypothetical protein
MKSHINADFRKAYAALPKDVREQARKAYKLFKEDPFHPSIRFKSIHPSKPFYSVRASLGYRAVGVREGDTIIWFWIGSHAAYDKLISHL